MHAIDEARTGEEGDDYRDAADAVSEAMLAYFDAGDAKRRTGVKFVPALGQARATIYTMVNAIIRGDENRIIEAFANAATGQALKAWQECSAIAVATK